MAHTDTVCGRKVTEGIMLIRNGVEYYFCSEQCKGTFLGNMQSKSPQPRNRPIAYGFAAAILLFIFCLSFIILANTFPNFFSTSFWVQTIPLIVSFGIYAGLYRYLSSFLKYISTSVTAALMISGIISFLSVISCCTPDYQAVQVLLDFISQHGLELAALSLIINITGSLSILNYIQESNFYTGTGSLGGVFRYNIERARKRFVIISITSFVLVVLYLNIPLDWIV